jgi:hypothetical protein
MVALAMASWFGCASTDPCADDMMVARVSGLPPFLMPSDNCAAPFEFDSKHQVTKLTSSHETMRTYGVGDNCSFPIRENSAACGTCKPQAPLDEQPFQCTSVPPTIAICRPYSFQT